MDNPINKITPEAAWYLGQSDACMAMILRLDVSCVDALSKLYHRKDRADRHFVKQMGWNQL